jgi:serine/threonine protein kinase
MDDVVDVNQFTAPEVYIYLDNDTELTKSYSYQIDVWAFGVMFFFMMNMSFPFRNYINTQKSIQI